MNFDIAAVRAASLILAVSTALSGCGGGNGVTEPDAQSTTSQAAAPSTPGTQDSASSAAAESSEVGSATVQSAGAALLGAAGAPTSTAPSTDTTQASGATTAPTDPASPAGSESVALGAPQVAGDVPVSIKSGGVAAARSGMAINLAGVISNGSQFPTIDLMKKASPWFTQCAGGTNCANFAVGANGYDTQEESKLNLDANGWVKSLPSAGDTTVKYRTVATKLAEGAVQQAGTYTVVYDGVGTIAYAGSASKVAAQSRPGRDIVNVTTTGTMGLQPFFITISSTDPTNYIRNVRVYMPGGACQGDLSTYVASAASCTAATGTYVPFENFPAGSVWHPTFLASIKGFRALRFMDWAATNSTPVVNWSERTGTTARSWFTSPTTGAPVEAMFDLAAKVGADPWMNIPPYASDAYVHAFGQLAHSKLAANSKLELEYGNEMWNYSFPATKWTVAQSRTTFPSALAAGANPVTVQGNWYALRLAQVCQIVKAEFGADASRVQCVANTQASVPSRTNDVLQCVYAKSILGQPCYKFIDVVAIAPYFGGYIGTSTTKATVDAWTAESDGGLDKMFAELTGTVINGLQAATPLAALNVGAPQGSVAQTSSWMVQTKAVLAQYNIPMWAYEGGQGLIPAPGDASALNLMIAANRDARMGAAYQTLLTNWKNAGGQTFALFSDVGAYRASGMWGLRENQWDVSAAKWKAAVAWRDKTACWWAGC